MQIWYPRSSVIHSCIEFRIFSNNNPANFLAYFLHQNGIHYENKNECLFHWKEIKGKFSHVITHLLKGHY